MFRTPQKSRGGPAWITPKKTALKGLFQDGIWHCNCDPRLPASRFQVKKEGKNKGRWFYTCQKPKESSCNLFLWDDNATEREKWVVIGNSRSEPDGLRTPIDAPRDTKATGYLAVGKKRDFATEDDDEFGDFALSAADLASAVEDTSRSIAPHIAYPETPRKAVKSSQFATPGSKIKWDGANLPTPSTGALMHGRVYGSGKDVFNTPSSRPKGGMWDDDKPFGFRSPSATPTPSRFRDAGDDSQTSQSAQSEYDITDEVMDALKDQNLDDETTRTLCQVLNRHALKISGIAKGRDITRLALKSKDLKIAELQQKITALEAEQEMNKTIIKHLKNDMSQSVANRKGRDSGRGI